MFDILRNRKGPAGPIGWPRLFAFLIFPLATFSPAAAQSVSGTVMEEGANAPVVQARVTLVSSEGEVVSEGTTDRSGNFRVEAPLPGIYTLRIIRLGFASFTSAELRLVQEETTVVRIRLTVRAIGLEPMTIVGRRHMENARLREFYQRAEFTRRLGSGRILYREDLDSRGDLRYTLAGIPVRPNCQRDFYIDGFRVDPEDQQYFLNSTTDLEGVEIYSSVTGIPPQYQGLGTCGVVLMWSRPADGPSIGWDGRTLVAGLVTAALFLLPWP